MIIIKKISVFYIIFALIGGVLAFSTPSTPSAKAESENPVEIIFFYSDTCPHCANVKPFLDELTKKYGDALNIYRLRPGTDQNASSLFYEALSIYNISQNEAGVPLLLIGDKSLMGDTPIKNSLEEEIKKCQETKCSLKGNLSEYIASGSVPAESLSQNTISDQNTAKKNSLSYLLILIPPALIFMIVLVFLFGKRKK